MAHDQCIIMMHDVFTLPELGDPRESTSFWEVDPSLESLAAEPGPADNLP